MGPASVGRVTAFAPFDDHSTVPSLTVETTATADLGPLVPLLEAGHPLAWMRRGFGLVGHGEALRLEFCGPDRMRNAATVWQRIATAASVTDPLVRTGTGLLAFGSFAFSDSSATTSVLIVPSVIIGRDKGQSWLTRIAVGELEPLVVPPLEPYGPRYHVDLHPGTVPDADYRLAVAAAVARIRSHEVSKVVWSALR